eukprot:scpid7956/ scgid1760/ Fibroblast growth factor receptor; Protein kringelchen
MASSHHVFLLSVIVTLAKTSATATTDLPPNLSTETLPTAPPHLPTHRSSGSVGTAKRGQATRGQAKRICPCSETLACKRQTFNLPGDEINFSRCLEKLSESLLQEEREAYYNQTENCVSKAAWPKSMFTGDGSQPAIQAGSCLSWPTSTSVSVVVAEPTARDAMQSLLSSVQFHVHRLLEIAGVDSDSFGLAYSAWRISEDHTQLLPHAADPIFVSGDTKGVMQQALLDKVESADESYLGQAVAAIDRSQYSDILTNPVDVDFTTVTDLILGRERELSPQRKCIILAVVPSSGYFIFPAKGEFWPNPNYHKELLQAWNCTLHAIMPLYEYTDLEPGHWGVGYGRERYISVDPDAPPATPYWKSMDESLRQSILNATGDLGKAVFDTGGMIFRSQLPETELLSPSSGKEHPSRIWFVIAETLARLIIGETPNELLESQCRCSDQRQDPILLTDHPPSHPWKPPSPFARWHVLPIQDRGCSEFCEGQPSDSALAIRDNNYKSVFYSSCRRASPGSSEVVRNSPPFVLEWDCPLIDPSTITYNQPRRVADVVIIVEEAPSLRNVHRKMAGLVMEIDRSLRQRGFGADQSRNLYTIVGMGSSEGVHGRFLLSSCSAAYLYPAECVASAARQLIHRTENQRGFIPRLDTLAALSFAIANTPWRRNAVRNILLVMDRNWEYSRILGPPDIEMMLECYKIALHSVIYNRFTSLGQETFGTDHHRFKYTFASNLTRIGKDPVDIRGGLSATYDNIGTLALDSNGSAWSIEQFTNDYPGFLAYMPVVLAQLAEERYLQILPCTCSMPDEVYPSNPYHLIVHCFPCNETKCKEVQQEENARIVAKLLEEEAEEAESYLNETACSDYSAQTLNGSCALATANILFLVDLGEENYRLLQLLPGFAAELEERFVARGVGQAQSSPSARRNLYSVFGFDASGLVSSSVHSTAGSATAVPIERVAEAVGSLPFPSRHEGNGITALADLPEKIKSLRTGRYDTVVFLSANTKKPAGCILEYVLPHPFICRSVSYHFLLPFDITQPESSQDTQMYGVDPSGAGLNACIGNKVVPGATVSTSSESRYWDASSWFGAHRWTISDLAASSRKVTRMTSAIAKGIAQQTQSAGEKQASGHQCALDDGIIVCRDYFGPDEECLWKPEPTTSPSTFPTTSTTEAQAQAAMTTKPPVTQAPESVIITTSARTETQAWTSGFQTSGATPSRTPSPVEGPSDGSQLLVIIPAIAGSVCLLVFLIIALIFHKAYRKRKQSKNPVSCALEVGISAEVLPSIRDVTNHATAMLAAPVNTSVTVLPVSLLKLGKIIGKGQFGEVYLGWISCRDEKNREVEQIAAIKTLNVLCSDEATHNSLIEELILQKSIGDHPNVVSIITGGLYNGNACIVMEYMSGGDLHSFLLDIKKNTALTPITDPHLMPNERLDICRQIALGMEFLASKQIVHRDLAARNVLVREHHKLRGKLEAKISDLGLSRAAIHNGKYEAQTSRMLPIKWTAVESITTGSFSSQSDVWSFGVLMWEVETCGDLPYDGKPNALLADILLKGYRLERPTGCPDRIYSLMMQCWDLDPNSRPDFSALIQELSQELESHLNYIQVEEGGVNMCITPASLPDTDRRPSALETLLERIRQSTEHLEIEAPETGLSCSGHNFVTPQSALGLSISLTADGFSHGHRHSAAGFIPDVSGSCLSRNGLLGNSATPGMGRARSFSSSQESAALSIALRTMSPKEPAALPVLVDDVESARYVMQPPVHSHHGSREDVREDYRMPSPAVFEIQPE